MWALLRAARKAYKEWKAMDPHDREAVATEAQHVRALTIELGGAPAAHFVDGSAEAHAGAAGAPDSRRPKEVVAGELREAVEALTRACMRPGAKVLRESTPRSARFGARMVKAGASRVMPRIQDRMRASSEPATVSVPAELHPPGWYADPAGRFDYRYWNGGQWSDHVSRNGLAETDAFERPPDSRTSASVSGE